jgi:hypothetical protein
VTLRSCTPLDPDALRAAIDASRPAIERDPLYRALVGSRSPFDEIARALEDPPENLEELLGESLFERWGAQYAIALALAPMRSDATQTVATVHLGGEDDPVLVQGSLHVTGDLSITGNLLVVLGDLVVEGTYSGGERSELVVGGRMTCGMVFATGEIVVGGDLTMFIGYVTYNDCSLNVGHTLRAGVLIQDVHHVCAARFQVDHHAALPRSDGQKGGVLRPELLEDDEGDPDFALIARAYAAGQPILAEGYAGPKPGDWAISIIDRSTG